MRLVNAEEKALDASIFGATWRDVSEWHLLLACMCRIERRY
jgi:hypothetical protein